MANNLLDKSSIILTPTAYNNGEALCVKPSDGSGDFDFNRNSAATRVNAQGLVENVQILSSNLVQNGDFSEEGVQEVSNGSFSQEGVEQITNGDFSNGSTGWDLRGVTTVYDDKANTVSTSSQYILLQNSVTTIGKQYKITYDLVVDSGTLVTYYDTVNLSSRYRTTSGTYTEYFEAVALNMAFRSVGNFTGSIDNVSVREVAQDWTLGTGWSIAEDKAAANTTGSTNGLLQISAITSGKIYKATFEVLDYQSGSVRINLGGAGLTGVGNLVSANGVYTQYITSDGVDVYMQGRVGFNGSITNISVKEVGQNWVLDANWSIAEDKAVSDGSINGFIRTSTNVFESGKTYKVGITVSNMTGGLVSYPYDGAATSYISTNGIYETIYTPNTTNVCYVYGRNGFDGSITNISVIEITDDTNLPRINYEGFSYQDALGSELLTDGAIINSGGGSFTFTPNGLIAISDGTSGTVARPILLWTTLTIGKQYRIVGTPTINSGNTNYSLYDGGAYVKNQVAVEAFDITFTCQGSSVFFTNDGTQTFDIDWDLSIKEVTGQEVVPDSGCGSWLFEPQSTNVITQSETFSDASWVNNGVTITSNEITSPSGTLNADLLTGVSGGFGVVKFSTWTATNKVASCFAKKGSTNLFKIANVSGGIGGVTFNLENGTVTNEDSGFDGEIENYGNGWYRCTAIDTLGRTGTFSLGVTAASESVYIWGAMLEQNSFSTSYIPTSGSQVTRNQDLCTNGGSLASINSTEGTLYFEGSVLANDGTTRFLGLSDGTSNNRVVILYYSPINKIRFIIESEDVKYLDANFLLSDITEFHKVAISYKLNDFKVYVDGVLKINDTIGNTPIGLNVLSFDLGGSSPFFGKTKALAVWKEALSDSELTELTTI